MTRWRCCCRWARWFLQNSAFDAAAFAQNVRLMQLALGLALGFDLGKLASGAVAKVYLLFRPLYTVFGGGFGAAAFWVGPLLDGNGF